MLTSSCSMFQAGRFVSDMSIGILVTVCPMYFAEMSSPFKRGWLVGHHAIFLVFGYMLSGWIGYACYFATLPAGPQSAHSHHRLVLATSISEMAPPAHFAQRTKRTKRNETKSIKTKTFFQAPPSPPPHATFGSASPSHSQSQLQLPTPPLPPSPSGSAMGSSSPTRQPPR